MSLVEDGTGLLRRQVDTLAGGAGRVLNGVTGVVDSSFGMLRQLLPGTTSPIPITPPLDSTSGAAPWNFPHIGSASMTRPGFGLLRRETGFSIGGISIGGRSERPEEELKEVSRPGSVRGSVRGAGANSDEGESEDGGEEGSADEEEDYYYDHDAGAPSHDARSIRSFESMMSRERSKGRGVRKPSSGRKSLSDRLAHVSSGLAGLKASPACIAVSNQINDFKGVAAAAPGILTCHSEPL